MAKQYDFLFRLLMLGDSGVGKTCMLRRFTESDFDTTHISTIGKPSNRFSVKLSPKLISVFFPHRLNQLNTGKFFSLDECRCRVLTFRAFYFSFPICSEYKSGPTYRIKGPQVQTASHGKVCLEGFLLPTLKHNESIRWNVFA